VPESFAKAEEEPEALFLLGAAEVHPEASQSGSRVQKYVVDLDLKVSFPLTNLSWS